LKPDKLDLLRVVLCAKPDVQNDSNDPSSVSDLWKLQVLLTPVSECFCFLLRVAALAALQFLCFAQDHSESGPYLTSVRFSNARKLIFERYFLAKG